MIFLATIALILFASLAAFDSYYFHIYSQKLYLYPDTRKEHVFHTVRNFIMLFVIYFLFVHNYSGILLWIGVLAVLLDIITLLFDLLIETDGRKRFGGIPKWEYLLHVMANGVYFASLTLLLCSKDISQWDIHSSYVSSQNRSTFELSASIILFASIISFLIHLFLCFKHEKQE